MALLSAAWVRMTGGQHDDRGGARGRKALPVTLVAWLAALIAVAILVRNDLGTPSHLRLVDLNVYRDGGRGLLRGRQIYSIKSRNGLLFTYPPFAAVLAVPLALISWPAAQLAWIPLVYVPLAVVIGYSFRPLLARAGAYAPAAFAGIFATCAYLLPMRQEIFYGQVDILLVALCVLDLRARRAPWPRGMLIGLATAIKLVPGVFIVYLLITGRRKAAAVAAATFAALSGLAWLISPQDSVRYWTSAVFDSKRLGPNMPAANQSVRGMLLRLFVPHSMPVPAWLAVALVIAAAGFAAARYARGRSGEMAGIAIVGLLAALLSPVAWIHHLCWIVVVLGVLAGDGRSPRRVATAAVTTLLFISSMPVWGKEMYMYVRFVPVLADRVVEDSFGLAALALIAIIAAIRPTDADIGRPLPPGAPGDAAGAAAEPLILAGSRDG